MRCHKSSCKHGLSALIFAISVYGLIVGGAMGFVLRQEWKYGGGNHWLYFATPLDRLIQSTGYWGLFPLCVPLFVMSVVAFWKSRIVWGVILAAEGALLAIITDLFVRLAQD